MKFNILIQPSGIKFKAPQEKTILQSALDADYHLAYSCQDGRCGKCKAKILSGRVEPQKVNSSITEDEINDGYLLTCLAKPDSDLILDASYYPELQGIKSTIQPCKVVSLDFVTTETVIIKLKLAPNSNFNFLTGQYIDLVIDKQRRSYSIASANIKSDGIVLHVRKVTGGMFSNIIFKKLKINQLLQLEGPFGTYFVRDNDRPIIFLAGGSGYAPVNAMVEDLLNKNSKRKIYIYWGVEFFKQFYCDSPIVWQQQNENISFIPVVSGNDQHWTGRTGLVHTAVLSDIKDISIFDIYACGSSVMIDAVKKDFLENGLMIENFYSDAFIPSN